MVISQEIRALFQQREIGRGVEMAIGEVRVW